MDSRYAPVRNRVQKLLDEEAFHLDYAAGWAQRIAGSGARDALGEAVARLLPVALRWLTGADADAARRLQEEGIVREGADALRQRHLRCVGPVLRQAELAPAAGLVEGEGGWRPAAEPDWSGWSTARRRAEGGGPDADTLARVRDDRNRAMLLD